MHLESVLLCHLPFATYSNYHGFNSYLPFLGIIRKNLICVLSRLLLSKALIQLDMMKNSSRLFYFTKILQQDTWVFGSYIILHSILLVNEHTWAIYH